MNNIPVELISHYEGDTKSVTSKLHKGINHYATFI